MTTTASDELPFRLATGDVLRVSSSHVTFTGRASRKPSSSGSAARAPAGKPVLVSIAQADLIGARILPDDDDAASAEVEIAELVEPRAARCFGRPPSDTIVRQLLTYVAPLVSRAEALRLVAILRGLALGSSTRTRMLRVLLNPHSGRRTALALYAERIAPIFAYAGIDTDVTVSAHAGHAIEVGRALDPATCEGVLVVGGDGTVQELVSGLLSRPEWRMLIRRVLICSVACGTQNALARGLRTTQPEYAAFCMIKHRLRPLDAMLVSNAAGLRTIALCGVGFGLAADIAEDSEAFRWLGVARYAFLKVVHSLALMLGLSHHRASIVMDADVALDDVALALYFAKPLALQRVPTTRGRVIISRLPAVDLEAESDDAVLARLLLRSAAGPPDARSASHTRAAADGVSAARARDRGGECGGGGASGRIAHLQLSASALAPFLGAAAAGDVTREAARGLGQRVYRGAGGGELAGVDSGVTQAMADDALVGGAGVGLALAAPPEAEGAEDALAGDGSDDGSTRHRHHHHDPQPSLLSAPAARRAGGGIVTLDEPTVAMVARMHAARDLAAQGVELHDDRGGAHARGGGLATMMLTGCVAASSSAAEPPAVQPAPAGGTAPAHTAAGAPALVEQTSYCAPPFTTPHGALADDSGVAGGAAVTVAATGAAGRPVTQQEVRLAAPVPVACAEAQLPAPLPLGGGVVAVTAGDGCGAQLAAQPRPRSSLHAPVCLLAPCDDHDAAAAGGADGHGGGDALLLASSRAVSPRFGALVYCTRDCATCRHNGTLRYIGHQRDAIVVGLRPTSPVAVASAADQQREGATGQQAPPLRGPGGTTAGAARGAGGALDEQAVIIVSRGSALPASGSGRGGGLSRADPAAAASATAADWLPPSGGEDGGGGGGGASRLLLLASTSPISRIGQHCHTASTVMGCPETAGEPRLGLGLGLNEPPPRLAREAGTTPTPAAAAAATLAASAELPSCYWGDAPSPAAAAGAVCVSCSALARTSMAIVSGDGLLPPDGSGAAPPRAHTYSTEGAWATDIPRAPSARASRTGGGGGGGGGLLSRSGSREAGRAAPPLRAPPAATTAPGGSHHPAEGGRGGGAEATQAAQPLLLPVEHDEAAAAHPVSARALHAPPLTAVEHTAAAGAGAAAAADAAASTASAPTPSSLLLPPGVHAHTRRNFERRAENGSYITVGLMNVCPDARFAHPCDGYLDLVVARKGPPLPSLGLLLRYLVGRERGSALYTYVKVRSVALSPEDPNAALNVDGEILPGPGPFTVHLLPSLLTAYGEL